MRTAVAVLALVAFAAVAVSAQSSTGSAFGTPANLCQRLTKGYNPTGDFTDAATQYAAIENGFITTVAAGNSAAGYSQTGLFNNALTANYFNGKINYRQNGPTPSPFGTSASPDFTVAKSAAQVSLVQHLSSFFGETLGCAVGASSTSAYPAYTSTVQGFGNFNQFQVHANMNITQDLFNVFVLNAAAAAKLYGATTDDITAVGTALLAFGRNTYSNANEICTQVSATDATKTCSCAPTVTGANCDTPVTAAASAVQLSFVSMIAAAVLALFAMRR